MGDGLVLARLPGENQQEFIAVLIEDRLDDGPQRSDLVLPQRLLNDQAGKVRDVAEQVLGSAGHEGPETVLVLGLAPGAAGPVGARWLFGLARRQPLQGASRESREPHW